MRPKSAAISALVRATVLRSSAMREVLTPVVISTSGIA